jgi:hypothetical protein
MTRGAANDAVAAILGSGVATIDGTIVSVALPAIERDLGGGLRIVRVAVFVAVFAGAGSDPRQTRSATASSPRPAPAPACRSWGRWRAPRSRAMRKSSSLFSNAV